MAATVAYLETQTDTTDTTTYAFTASTFGTANSDRYIAAVVHGRKSGASTTLATASCAIGGISVTNAIEVSSDGANTNLCAILIANVPTDADLSIDVVFNASQLNCAIDIYEIHGINGATPYATDSDGTTADPSLSFNVEAGGIAICGSDTASATSAAWTGVTEDVDSVIETFHFYSAASDAFASAQTPLSVGLTWTGTNVQTATVGASWSQSAAGGANPKNPLGLPLYGPFGGPIGA